MSKLFPHEWIIVSLLIITLCLLTYVSLGRNVSLPPANTTAELTSDVVQVSISGAVANPGSFELKKGSKLKDLLALAEPITEADLSKIKPNARLKDGQTIKIPALIWLNIHVIGAIEEEEQLLCVLKGTKLQDIVEKIEFAPNADIAKLQKKRLLKDGETVEVTLKKPKKGEAGRKIA